MKHHIIFLVFALVIFHKYRPEQRIPSFFSSTRTFRINFLSNLSRCCFRHLHPRLLHNRLLFGTRTAVSLNCPVGTGVLCWSRNTFMDLLFQTLSEDCCCAKINSHPGHVTGKWKILGQKGERKFEIKNKSHLCTLACWWQNPRSGQHIWTKKKLLCRSTHTYIGQPLRVPSPVKNRNAKLKAWNLHPRHE